MSFTIEVLLGIQPKVEQSEERIRRSCSEDTELEGASVTFLK